MTVVSVCLPSDALFQCLLSYWGFSYLGCGVSLHNAPAKLSRCSFHWMWVISLGLLRTLDLEYLTEEEDIKKRWQEYTEELYKKDLHDPDNHSGLITHLEPGILECEVKVGLRKHHYEQS